MWRAELTSSGAGREAFEPSGARNRTFLMPPPGAPTGIVNPCNLQSAAPSEPKQVLIFVRGDVGDSLQHVNGQPTPPANNLPPIVDGSLSVAGGDAINTGWSVDYYGHSTNRRGHGNGIGWRSQENEQVAGVWPRKYVCCICSLQWAVTPLSNTLFRNGYALMYFVSVKHVQGRLRDTQPNPPDARRDPGFTRPQSSELHYYLDHKVTPDEPCVRGLCQTCRPVSLLPDGQPSRNCCPPQVANTNHLKEIYRCVMDNCPILTDRRANMKTHLSSHAHNDYLTELARRIKMGETLTAIDKQITYRLMHLFDNLDARGQKLINQPRSTVPLPEDISSPAVLREHTQWMFFLGLYAPEVHRRAFFDPETNQNYFRDYNLGEFGSVPGNLRIVSGATGRPVEASQFLWRQR
ncbi:hypothetical protein CSPAE12_05371 [Colletotrichum incanum]|nr:hypothetical protein CSPAE12_05371 [Colletotrichum incanum]